MPFRGCMAAWRVHGQRMKWFPLMLLRHGGSLKIHPTADSPDLVPEKPCSGFLVSRIFGIGCRHQAV